MLIEFTVGNFLSFKEKKTLSLEATSIKDNPENIIETGKYKLLRSAVIYGANSSGKSNLIKALNRMAKIVLSSAQNNSTSEINVVQFLLNSETEEQPSYFEILFVIDGERFRYGFEVDNKIVHKEWLFKLKMKTERALFFREKDAIEVTKYFEEGKGIESKTRDNALFLSVTDQFNGEISKKIMNWFSKFNNLSGLQHEDEKYLTIALLKNEALAFMIKDFLHPLNLGFQDFIFKGNKVSTIHNKFDEDGKVIDKYEFDLFEQESSGTNKLYDIAGGLTFGLKLGELTIIDELDAKLHPLLTLAIVKLFNSPTHNPNNAQLIFATHDTNLLGYGCFRRDQIYFTEKNKYEETDLYSLVEYIEPNGSKVRNDRSFEKDYISGRYGAIPFVGDFSKLVSDGQSSEN
ncbi:MAG TPA: ATP-binding protein [Prolixibacteraceae bacterium]|nr:ATP-binding protein [Prolixibacteraceae bacterium]